MSNDFPRLHFRETFDEYTAFEIRCKGWCSGVIVEIENGDRYSVFFYDPVRLAQELDQRAERGQPFVAEPGLIVVSEVTVTVMQDAVAQLYKAGWFEHLKPLTGKPFTFEVDEYLFVARGELTGRAELRLWGRIVDGVICKGTAINIPTADGTITGTVSQFYDTLDDWTGLPFYIQLQSASEPVCLCVTELPPNTQPICPTIIKG